MSGRGCGGDHTDNGCGAVPPAPPRWYSSVGSDEFRCQSPTFREGSVHGISEKPLLDRWPAKPSRGASFRTEYCQKSGEASASLPLRQHSKMGKHASEVPVRQGIRRKDSYEIPDMRVHSYTLPPRFPVRTSSEECGPQHDDSSEIDGLDGAYSCDSHHDGGGAHLREPLRDRDVNRAASQVDVSGESRNVLIQVAPGVRVPLRSGSETWQAIIDDFYVPCPCLGCSTTLFVIQDAAYVLCPCCRSISPMEGQFVNLFVAGAGMGFTFDDLTRWQDDIMRDSR
jgi:hypothetical protein